MTEPARNARGNFKTDIETEFHAVDSLGPRTRHAINEARFPFSAASLIGLCTARGVDPCQPEFDIAFARLVQREDEDLLAEHRAQANTTDLEP